MKVIIVGGGIGGLCLANGLCKSNVSVAVYERQANPEANLAGYGIHIDRNGRKALKQCLSETTWNQFLSLSTAAGTQMFFHDEQFHLLAERDDAVLSGRSLEDMERRGIGRIELRDLLLKDIQHCVHWGKAFDRYEELEHSRVKVYFTDGTSEEGDVLIGADGSHSKVRQQYLPHIQRDDLGILAIAGRYILTPETKKNLPRSMTDGSLNNIVPTGKGWLFIASWRGKNVEQVVEDFVVWAYVVPKSDTIPGQQLSPHQLQHLALNGVRGWSPLFTKLIQDTDLTTIAPVPLKSMPVLEPWQSSNITLLGDAIHNMTPMAGVGANTALRDAECLQQVLTNVTVGRYDLKDGIRSYESKMREYANAAVGLSRRNAENASAGTTFGRHFFRGLLRLAQASPLVMRHTIGKTVVSEC